MKVHYVIGGFGYTVCGIGLQPVSAYGGYLTSERTQVTCKNCIRALQKG